MLANNIVALGFDGVIGGGYVQNLQRQAISVESFNERMKGLKINFSRVCYFLHEYYLHANTNAQSLYLVRRFKNVLIFQLEYFDFKSSKNGWVYFSISDCDFEKHECILTFFQKDAKFPQYHIFSDGKYVGVIAEQHGRLSRVHDEKEELAQSDPIVIEQLKSLAEEYNFNYNNVENLLVTTYIEGVSPENMAWVDSENKNGITFKVACRRTFLPWCDSAYVQISDMALWKKEFKLTFFGYNNQTVEYQFSKGVFTRINE